MTEFKSHQTLEIRRIEAQFSITPPLFNTFNVAIINRKHKIYKLTHKVCWKMIQD